MVKVKTVEKQIWDLEGFDVAILREDGRDIRGDRNGLPAYPFERCAKNDMTVAAWKEQRFLPNYSGFHVAVYDGDGQEVHGGTKLGTLRDTYLEE
ncbi:MAG: hypothetical protein C3F12_06225 [Candidatus Methylomirabilota bacterium]|nr:hypothetical protein [Candidatus Methylomirabilis sp.]NJD69170.1 hypothetical protein [candidate division NC10 bacterium]PWB47554.1 MAG: hypothetical protein C3F12_06225 [candidate division NC10 bacterium]